MFRFAIVFVCLALVSACAPPSSTRDEQAAAAGREADPVLSELGAEYFQRYCAACHGVDARGNGPVSGSLQVPPLDLRRIALRRGGDFPAAEIGRKIDGRFEIEPHGSREMPVWGQVFASDVPEMEMAESITRGYVSALVEYLKSIQDPLSAGADPAQIRATMGEVYEAMRQLLPLVFSAEGFESPDDQVRIAAALHRLDRSSTQLAQHGASDDAGFAHLARSLAIDARDIRLRYDAGHPGEARYLVQTLVDTCIACHSRLPSGSAPRSEAFVSDIEVLELPTARRARLAYATRQFDSAVALYESMLDSTDYPAGQLDMGGHVEDYLELMMRVRHDPARAAETLGRFARRPDLSLALREEIMSWSASLAALEDTQEPASLVGAAHRLVHDGDARIGTERDRLVEDLAASSMLHRALEGSLSRDRRAEAYYLLGLLETRIGRSYWLSEAEAYLETAIHLAPGQPIAQDAYRLLEEYLVAGYTGSAGTNVPADIQDKLDQLSRVAMPPSDQG